MSAPKVLLVNGSAPAVRCGVGIYSRQLLAHLSSLCDVSMLTTKSGQSSSDANTLTVPNWKIRSLFRMRAAAKKSAATVVHIQYPAVGYKRELGINLLPLLLRTTTRKKVVLTLHEYYGSARLGKIRNVITALFAHTIIVSNEYDKHALPFIIRRKTIIIRIGHTIQKQHANKQTFTSALRAAGFSATQPTIAYFGFVNPSKGLHMLAQAMPSIPAQLMLLCELQPENSYHNEVLEHIKTARAQGARIWVAGYTEDQQLSEILQECSFFVLPQPLPLTAKSSTAIVAAEHGLPVVATAAAKSLFNEPFTAQNSVLIPRMTAESLAEACTNLIEHPKALQDIKKHNQALVQHFSWGHIATQHADLYSSLL